MNDEEEKHKDIFECVICMDVMRPPIKMCPLGHSFCGDCLMKFIAVKNKSSNGNGNDIQGPCPTCKTMCIAGKLGRNYNLERCYETVYRPCAHEKCGRQILLVHYLDHFKDKCPYRPAQCENRDIGCKWSGPARDLEQTHSGECIYRECRNAIRTLYKRCTEVENKLKTYRTPMEAKIEKLRTRLVELSKFQEDVGKFCTVSQRIHLSEIYAYRRIQMLPQCDARSHFIAFPTIKMFGRTWRVGIEALRTFGQFGLYMRLFDDDDNDDNSGGGGGDGDNGKLELTKSNKQQQRRRRKSRSLELSVVATVMYYNATIEQFTPVETQTRDTFAHRYTRRSPVHGIPVAIRVPMERASGMVCDFWDRDAHGENSLLFIDLHCIDMHAAAIYEKTKKKRKRKKRKQKKGKKSSGSDSEMERE